MQKIQVKVIDKNGKPIAGANIVLPSCPQFITGIDGIAKVVLTSEKVFVAIAYKYIPVEVEIKLNKHYYEVTLIKEKFFYRRIRPFLGAGLSQLSNPLQNNSFLITTGVLIKTPSWRKWGLQSGLHYRTIVKV